MLKTGIILAERYRLDDPIAAGGVGQVWRGTDLVLQRRVALKLLRPEYAEHPEMLERFRAEARNAGSLTHPCIAQVHDYGSGGPGQPPFLVMELVDGPSLADVLAAQPVSAAYALDVIAKAAAGLAAAHHAGVVHRDLKPGNILLGPDGQVKISDFGIAHAAGSARITDPGLVMGTTQYLAPERIAGTPASPASDLYSLGIVLHECLTGVPPFEGTPAEVLAGHLHLPLPPPPPGTPAEVEDLITRLTCKDPSGRLSDAGDLATIARRLATAIASGRASAPRQRPAPDISHATGSPVTGSPANSFPAAGPAAGAPQIQPAGPGWPSAPAHRTPPRTAPGPVSGPPSSGFALHTAFGEFSPNGGSAAEVRAPEWRAAEGSAADAAGHSAFTRRHIAIASGILLLAAAGATGWLLAGGQQGNADGGHLARPTPLGVIQPSASNQSPGHPAPTAGAGAGKSGKKPDPATTPAAAKKASGAARPSASPAGQASSTPGSSPSAPASTRPSTAPSPAPPSATPKPSSSPTCGGLLSCIGL
ncbi:MAG TPA: protein kinase [Trebonia sp.]|nr:protein kinase [Trebonia sp.]